MTFYRSLRPDVKEMGGDVKERSLKGSLAEPM